MAKGKIHIGTSGWSYKHWQGSFYPDDVKSKSHFEYYRKFFDTVELNAPFYRLPSKETFQNWHNAVEPNFLFSVKASRFITHMKKLKDPVESSSRFLEHAEALAENLGPILFQLPPMWKINIGRLADFLEKLPKHHRYTFEFRNHSWYEKSIYDLLQKHNCAFCIYDLAGHLTPIEVTADFVYMRLHGPEGKYSGNYPEETLSGWAAKCVQWSNEGKDVFVYFDNDIGTFAPYNAIRLIELTR